MITQQKDTGLIFSSMLFLILGIINVIISIVKNNAQCENKLSTILLVLGILLIITFFAQSNVWGSFYGVADSYVGYFILNLLIVASLIVTVILSIYTFSINISHHTCDNILYWYSFSICIFLLLIYTFTIIPNLISTRGRLYQHRSSDTLRPIV